MCRSSAKVRERAFFELDNRAPARFCVMQMQIQIKTECSFAVKIYKSRQHQQVANPRANDPRDRRIERSEEQKRRM